MEQRVNQQMTSSTHVARAREMGFTDETIRAALTRHYNLCQEFFPTAQHL
uniref:Uncharacterized protein n=1 Tax=Ciona savignyi TaxID=51511 RepID=H2YP79_CIOSA